MIYDFNNSLGIPRTQLPQIDFENYENAKKSLTNDSIKFAVGNMYCKKLKPTQDQLNLDKIVNMIKDGKHLEDRTIFVSREGFIVDGHHGWAAKLKNDSDSMIGVILVDMNIIDLINWFKNQDFTFTKNINEGKQL